MTKKNNKKSKIKDTARVPATTNSQKCEHRVHKLTKEEDNVFTKILEENNGKAGIKRSSDEVRMIIAANERKITYNECTKYIRENINTAMRVAEKLYAVKVNKLYKLRFDTFEEYVDEMFKFTRERAYQLTRAHEIAKYVNDKLGSEVIVNESQARELLKFKRFSDADVIDIEATNIGRAELVNSIKGECGSVSAKQISKKIKERMKDIKEDNSKKRKIEKYKRYFKASFIACKASLEKARVSDAVSKEEKENLKNDCLAELKAFIATLEK